jgi:hypothetical protein
VTKRINIATLPARGRVGYSPRVDPELRAYLDQRFNAVDERFNVVGRQLEAVGRRFIELEAELRRHFGILVQQIRHELQVVAEMVVANTEAIARLRAQRDAR